MEKISKDNFANLLLDLYDIFNPEHKTYVPGLVDRNVDIPLDSVDMILFKYNQPTSPFYDPEMNSQTYQMRLISQYAKGNRPLKELDIKKRIQEIEQQQLEEQKEKQSKESKLEESVKLQTEELSKKAQEEIQSSKKIFDESLEELKKFRKEVESLLSNEQVEYKVRVNYTEVEIVLPNARRLAGLGIGARIVAKTKEGRPVGLVVKDITYDDFSHPENKTIIDIILDKA